ncbi:hypothetical protein CRYUN_Cryun15aG0001800 [Craigia yunnanensis]
MRGNCGVQDGRTEKYFQGRHCHIPTFDAFADVAASELVTWSIRMMMESGCEEVTLEAEVTNIGALALYGRLGFIRAKWLFHYYLNGVDAFRSKLLFPRRELHHSELTYDYGYALDSVYGPDGKVKRMPCYCGQKIAENAYSRC